MSGPIFLESGAKVILVLHALVAFALLGACTHCALVMVRLLKGRYQLARLARVYAQVIGGTFAAAFALGLLMYPAYRWHVRAMHLDHEAMWAANLFDFKENLAALALPFAVGLWALGRKFRGEGDRELVPYLAFLAVTVWIVVAFAAISGLLVTSVRGV